MKHLTDANKDKLLAFLRSRAAAGEASLKSWGRDQRPQIPGSLVEEIADALVAEGKATCGVRTHGGRVWRAAIDAPPAPEPDVEEEPEKEPVVVAGDAEPCQECDRLRQERDMAQGEAHGLRQQVAASATLAADAGRQYTHLLDAWQRLCHLLDVPSGRLDPALDRVRLLVAAAKTRAEAPAVDEEPDVEGAAEEEPIAVAGGAEPCQGCEARSAELARVSSWLEKVRSDRDAARVMADLYGEAICGLVPDLRGSSPVRLAEGLEDLVRTLREQIADHEGDWALIRSHLWLSEKADRQAILDRASEYARLARSERPAVDPGAIAHYLLELPADRWEALAIARQQLAEGRTLAERATRLQTEALATVEGILTAPAGEAPVAEAAEEPEPPPSGPQSTSESDEPDPASVIGRVLRWLRKRPDARARQAAEALSLSVPHASAALVVLARRKLVERVELGLYRAVRAKEAA